MNSEEKHSGVSVPPLKKLKKRRQRRWCRVKAAAANAKESDVVGKVKRKRKGQKSKDLEKQGSSSPSSSSSSSTSDSAPAPVTPEKTCSFRDSAHPRKGTPCRAPLF